MIEEHSERRRQSSDSILSKLKKVCVFCDELNKRAVTHNILCKYLKDYFK